MLQALERRVVGLGLGRRWAVLGMLAIGGALGPLMANARRKAQLHRLDRRGLVEVNRLEVGGASCGAVYEDGRLVGILQGVDRL